MAVLIQEPMHGLAFGISAGDSKRLFIVIDEMDELYRRHPQPAFSSTLGELQDLGNSEKGRVCVLLCGSSAVLPLLISVEYDDDDGILVSNGIRSQYPLLHGAPDLNCTKYKTLHLMSPTPVSLDIVYSIYPDITIEAQRWILFLTGGNLREIKNLVDNVLKQRDEQHNRIPPDRFRAHVYGCFCTKFKNIMENNSGSATMTAAATATATWSTTSGTTATTAATCIHDHLLAHVLDKCIEKNSKLFDRLLSDDKFNAIGDSPWETQFLPLSKEDVEKIWKKLREGEGKLFNLEVDASGAAAGSNLKSNQIRLWPYLTHLSDRGCLVVLECYSESANFRIFPPFSFRGVATVL